MDGFKSFTMRGILKYPKFIKPMSFDNDSQKYIEDWEEGDFNTLLILNKDAAKDEIASLKAMHKEWLDVIIKGKKYPKDMEINSNNFPFREELNEEKKPTGNYEFKFKRSVKNKKGELAQIPYVDGKLQPIPKKVLEGITSGSEAVINYIVYPWDKKTRDSKTKEEYVDFGISLCLLGVQVIKAVKKSANTDCFSVVEDGYDALAETFEAGVTDICQDPEYMDELIGEDEVPF
jgi:hypothetical protein